MEYPFEQSDRGRRGQDSNPHTVYRETAFKAVAIPFRSPLRAVGKYIRKDGRGHIPLRNMTTEATRSGPSAWH